MLMEVRTCYSIHMGRGPFGQRELEFRYWGGERKSAGRKRQGALPRVAHRHRSLQSGRHPLHVTLRVSSRSLRSQFVFPSIRRVFAAVNRRAPELFRIVEFSVQANHIHLLLEAANREALLSGMRSLNTRLAIHVNRALMRRGPLLADRWTRFVIPEGGHSHELTSPRAVRNALRYLLANHVKHGSAEVGLDPYSSARKFTRFAESPGRALAPRDWMHDPPTATARTWLVSVGWWQHGGLLSIRDCE
jgi:putative transposase